MQDWQMNVYKTEYTVKHYGSVVPKLFGSSPPFDDVGTLSGPHQPQMGHTFFGLNEMHYDM